LKNQRNEMSKNNDSSKRLNSSKIRSITNVGGKEKSSRLIDDQKLTEIGMGPTGATENLVSDSSSKT